MLALRRYVKNIKSAKLGKEENVSKDQVDINRKLDKTTSTLTQLVQSSHKLVSENKDFLHMIYNDLDE